ncbi:unnamed protein product [Rotaria sp. Silwood1]|nr:unnamed protein product [Rotaria sp. Silwood1]
MTIKQMTLESLSNELLIELFELLNGIDVLRSFRGLNTRFNSLLLIYFRTYRVDLRSISKENFTLFCQTYLPLIINQIIHLRLSDDDDTPRQYFHLLSAGFKLNQFNRLRSLTFDNISSDPMINLFFFCDLSRLYQLTHLKFINCRISELEKQPAQDIIDRIWSLPKLTYCYWDLNYEEDDRPSSRQFIPSPKNLSVEKLALYEVCSQRVMINLFQLLPNINHLKVDMFSIKFTGHDWKQIIVKYLPQLKVFQLKMDFSFYRFINDQDNEEQVEQYLATYRTPFWIEHHQWFIRCHWRLWMASLCICIYTLPYKFDYFPVISNAYDSKTISTCPYEKYFSYDSVQQVSYSSSLFEDDTWSYIQLNNIRILHLQLPIDHHFFSIVPNIEHLHLLVVDIPERNDHLQLQALLDRALNLHFLVFNSWDTLEMPPYQLASASVRRLDLQGVNQSRHRHSYDLKQCMELSQSSLAIHCRVHHQNSTYSIGISLKYLIFKYEISTSVFASEIQLGDHLQLVNQDEIIPEKIIQIDEIISQDFSAPLTPSSTNIVNNLVSSNYAEARNHHLAHLVMQPHRLWRFILGLKQIIQTDFDWYISILYYFPHKTRLLHIL